MAKQSVEIYEDERGRLVEFAPKKKKSQDNYAHYSRGWMIPKIPCRIVFIGQSDSGKSDFCNAILDGEIPSLSMQYDTYCAYSLTRDDKLKAQPYREIHYPQESFPDLTSEHVIAIFDDPPPENIKHFTTL